MAAVTFTQVTNQINKAISSAPIQSGITAPAIIPNPPTIAAPAIVPVKPANAPSTAVQEKTAVAKVDDAKPANTVLEKKEATEKAILAKQEAAAVAVQKKWYADPSVLMKIAIVGILLYFIYKHMVK